jgi:hypothetical protein
MVKLKRAVGGHSRNHPDPTISGMPNLLRPKQPFQGWQAPAAITSNPVATIEGEEDLGSPMGWIKGTNLFELIESNALDRYGIANIEAKANPEQAHPRSPLNDAGQ